MHPTDGVVNEGIRMNKNLITVPNIYSRQIYIYLGAIIEQFPMIIGCILYLLPRMDRQTTVIFGQAGSLKVQRERQVGGHSRANSVYTPCVDVRTVRQSDLLCRRRRNGAVLFFVSFNCLTIDCAEFANISILGAWTSLARHSTFLLIDNNRNSPCRGNFWLVNVNCNCRTWNLYLDFHRAEFDRLYLTQIINLLRGSSAIYHPSSAVGCFLLSSK